MTRVLKSSQSGFVYENCIAVAGWSYKTLFGRFSAMSTGDFWVRFCGISVLRRNYQNRSIWIVGLLDWAAMKAWVPREPCLDNLNTANLSFLSRSVEAFVCCVKPLTISRLQLEIFQCPTFFLTALFSRKKYKLRRSPGSSPVMQMNLWDLSFHPHKLMIRSRTDK